MENNGEQWKVVEGYPSFMISDQGRVLNSRTGNILCPFKNNGKYLRIALRSYGKHKNLLVHRMVASAFIKNPTGLPVVDHKNNDYLDNRVENLRFASHSQSAMNRRFERTPTSQYASRFKGVYPQGSRWRAHIRVDGVLKHLGTYDTEEDAARVYDLKAVEYFGEFANLNFPEEHPAEATADDTVDDSIAPEAHPVEDDEDSETPAETDDYDSEDDGLGPYCDN